MIKISFRCLFPKLLHNLLLFAFAIRKIGESAKKKSS